MLREGEISVRLGLHRGRIDSVDIRSTRSPLPERFTRGRDVDELARTLPLLYSICARAQGAAAAAALGAARGTAVDAAALSRHSHAVRDEIVISSSHACCWTGRARSNCRRTPRPLRGCGRRPQTRCR